MRNLFIAAAKILALYQFCWTFRLMEKHGVFYRYFSGAPASGAFLQIAYLVLSLALAFFLAFKADAIADLLKLKDDQPLPIDKDVLLGTGLKLFGVYLLVCVVQTLFGAFTMALAAPLLQDDGFVVTQLFSLSMPVMAAIIALPLLFKTSAIVQLLTDSKQRSWIKIVIASIILFALYIAVNIVTDAANTRHMHDAYQNFPQLQADEFFFNESSVPIARPEFVMPDASDMHVETNNGQIFITFP